MKMKKLLALLCGSMVLAAGTSNAIDLSNYQGASIIYAGTVTGYIDEHGKQHDDFEGCDYDWKIILDDRKTVTCSQYSYTYSYRPQAVILVTKYGSWKMIINNSNEFDVRR